MPTSSSSSSSFSARSSTSSSFSARSSASSVSSYATSDISKDLSPIYPPSSSSSRERADLFPQPTLFDLSIPILPDPSPISDPSFFIDDIKPASPRIRHHPHRRHSHRSSSPDLLRYHHHNSLQQQQLHQQQLQQQQQQQLQQQQQPPLSDSSVGVVAATASSSSAVRVQFREDMLFGADGCIDDDDTIDAKIRAFKFSRDPESDYDADYDDDADSEPEAAPPVPHPAATAPHLHREKKSTRPPVKLSPIDTLFPDSLPSFHPTSNPPLQDPSYPPLQDLSLRDHIVQRLQQPPPLTTTTTPSASASASTSTSTSAKPISDLFPAPPPPTPLVQHPADHLSQLRKAESADILVSPLSDPGRHPHISLHSQLSNSSSPPPSSKQH